ncbi:MAG: hypothetical protein NT040_00175 [Bacteroidetes bacterium]|nr:hypothetical protein [Bacteroidota bacterium]
MKRLNLRHFLSCIKERFISKNLKVVYDDDVPTLLSSLDLLDKVDRGEIRCSNCNNIITREKFGYLKYVNGKVELYCINTNCICQQ